MRNKQIYATIINGKICTDSMLLVGPDNVVVNGYWKLIDNLDGTMNDPSGHKVHHIMDVGLLGDTSYLGYNEILSLAEEYIENWKDYQI